MPDGDSTIPTWFWKAAGAAVSVAGALALMSWLRDTPDTQDSVAIQWANAAKAYGFEPVYPPQEDFYVGDVFAIIAGDAAANILHEPLPTRAIKIGHLDLTSAIEREYGEGYRFPVSLDAPDKDDKIWVQKEATGSVFAHSGALKSLPVALLPDFTITAKRNAKFDVGGLFDFAGSHERQTSFKIKGVLTYGVLAPDVEWKLKEYCEEIMHRAFCTEKGLRLQLSNILGDSINEMWTDPITGAKMKRYTVELSAVSRVYLVRSLETEILDSSEAEANAKGAVNGTEASGAADSQSNAHAHSALQTFERPLAFGYRSVRYAIEN